jgi:hypothetical protein
MTMRCGASTFGTPSRSTSAAIEAIAVLSHGTLSRKLMKPGPATSALSISSA